MVELGSWPQGFAAPAHKAISAADHCSGIGQIL